MMHRITTWLLCMTLTALVGCGKSEPADSAATSESKTNGSTTKQAASAAGSGEKSESTEQAASDAPPFNMAMVGVFKPPVPEAVTHDDNPLTPQKIDLGRKLYYDTRFSIAQDISCNTCHALDQYGIDPRENNATSEGHAGQFGGRNSPTVYNAAGHIAQFWDGREPDVEAQAKGPVLNPVEMAMPNPEYVIKVLQSIPGYRDAFAKAFPDDDNPINYDNFGKAIGAFERKLTTPGKWDKFVAGDESALSDAEKAGLAEFITVGCTTCHMGTYLGGQLYQKVGLIHPWPNQEDKGRYDVTGNEADKFFFKVPSLRNIAETAPYFHDGSVESLDKAVRMMAHHQLGKELSDAQVDRIVTFLEALTGEIPADYIAKPELPESGPDTPGPKQS